MVAAPRRSRKSAGVSFVPPLPDDDPALQGLADELPPDHLARQIACGVDDLDLADFFASFRGQGCLPYRPDVLLRVVLYEMHSGVRSPARWCRDATESLPVRWLLQGYRPSRSVWYAFRDRLGPWLESFNAQVLARAIDAEITPAARGALDGTLIAANASRHRLVNEETLHKRLGQLDQAVAADTQPPSPAVAADTQAPPAVPGWMAPTAAGRLGQQQRYRQADAQMQQRQARNAQKRKSKRTKADKIVVSTSDPQAAVGRDKEKVFRPLYNTQFVADLDSPLLLSYGVFAQPNDNGTLGPLLERQVRLTGRKPGLLLADASYANGADLAIADAAGVTLLAPYQANDFTAASAGREPRQLAKQAFTWLPQEETYRCPQGHRLEYVRASRQKRSSIETVQVHEYRCPPCHCSACPLRERCTPNPEAGRTISRGEHDDLVEALRQRMETDEAKALYRLRRQTVELANADAKEHRKLRRFSGRGLARAAAEVGLQVLVHNLLVCVAHRPTSKQETAGSENRQKTTA